MSAWAKPGVKCVCVDNKGTRLVAGDVYVISSIRQAFGRTFLRIGGDSPADGYFIERFRPLISKTQEQDLELFLPLLIDLPVGEDA